MNVQFEEEVGLRQRALGGLPAAKENGPMVKLVIAWGITDSPVVAIRIVVGAALLMIVLAAFSAYRIIAPAPVPADFDFEATPPSAPVAQ